MKGPWRPASPPAARPSHPAPYPRVERKEGVAAIGLPCSSTCSGRSRRLHPYGHSSYASTNPRHGPGQKLLQERGLSHRGLPSPEQDVRGGQVKPPAPHGSQGIHSPSLCRVQPCSRAGPCRLHPLRGPKGGPGLVVLLLGQGPSTKEQDPASASSSWRSELGSRASLALCSPALVDGAGPALPTRQGWGCTKGAASFGCKAAAFRWGLCFLACKAPQGATGRVQGTAPGGAEASLPLVLVGLRGSRAGPSSSPFSQPCLGGPWLLLELPWGLLGAQGC